MTDFIKLKTESFAHANFNLLKNDFYFNVNGETFCTSKFLASILSPAVSNLLSTDETLNSFEINTNSRGDFQIFLNLFQSCQQEINDNDKEFLCEILETLQNKYLQIELNTNTTDITYENVFSNLLNELSYPRFYQEIIDKKISILSSNLYRILSNEEERQILSQLELEFIERILNHKQLLIESEDQLLEFINSLYEKNQESSFLYEYVNFVNCSSRSMQTFLNTFSIENINEGIWNQMKERLEQPIEQQNQINQSNRYHLKELNQTNQQFKEFPKGSADFDGIINYLRKQTNNQIENEIKITASSIYDNNVNTFGPYNSIQYENETYFATQNSPNSWICFEFKNHQIIPTHYTIRSRYEGYWAPIYYKIEVSNDNSTWYEIDKQNGGPFTNGQPATFTIPIDKNKQKEAKYIRLTQTGENSHGNDDLIFESIEFYGYLK